VHTVLVLRSKPCQTRPIESTTLRVHFVGVLLALSLVTGRARADLDGMYRVLQVAELVIPDLGLQLDTRGRYLVLSLPLQFTIVPPFAALRDTFVRPSATLLIEPQWVPSRKDVRAIVGTRWHFRLGRRAADGSISAWGLVSDFGAVGSTHGVGIVTGVGLGWLEWDANAPASNALMYRYTWLVDEPYHAIMLDLFCLPFVGND
jgi:hypothetical protein